MKRWVGINPVILAQKSQIFVALGWYQPSDFSLKKLFMKRCIGFNPVVLAQKNYYSETQG
jgi:hypothetical protein